MMSVRWEMMLGRMDLFGERVYFGGGGLCMCLCPRLGETLWRMRLSR